MTHKRREYLTKPVQDPTSRINNASAASGGFPSSSFSGRSGFANNPFEDDLFNMFLVVVAVHVEVLSHQGQHLHLEERVHIPIIWKRGR